MSEGFISSYVRSSLRLIRRNGGKIALFTAAAGSAIAAGMYLRRQISVVNNSLEQERAAGARKLRAAFVTNNHAVRTAFRALFPLIRETLGKVDLLDASEALARLRQKPKNRTEKQMLWEQVKLASITHVVSVIYLASVLYAALSLQMNLLARYSQSSFDAPVQALPAGPLSSSTSKAYLDKARCMVTDPETIDIVVQKLYKIVQANVNEIGLADRLSAVEIESLFVNILSAVEDGTNPDGHANDHAGESESCFKQFMLSMPHHWFFAEDIKDVTEHTDDANYKWLVEESLDLCEILDFSNVVSDNSYIALSHALASLQEEMNDITEGVPFAHLFARFHGLAAKLFMTVDGEIPNQERTESTGNGESLVRHLAESDHSAHFAASVFLSGEKDNSRREQPVEQIGRHSILGQPTAVQPLITDPTEPGDPSRVENLGLMFDLN